jgi:hypothetical protein
MPRALTVDEAAAELRKTPRWLREWLRTNPRDEYGELYYTPVGRAKILRQADIARIERALRDREGKQCRSSSGRRAPAKRRTTKSAEHIEGQRDHSAWKSAAELTGDPTLLDSSEPSKNASMSTAAGRRQHLSLIRGSRPS